ncbi:MAG: hypothetical protein EB127_00130 [Alphaproteobacteria bacterium]|nr:hypothetical protein [Alphaproteobacteria bacterium]
MRQVATAYTGANISVTIGNKFIANAFGISWELSQNKRPIYGYNSMYYDSVATGQVIVMGQLYINYQHPNYLSSLLRSYFKDAPLSSLSVAGFGETNNRNMDKGVFNAYTNRGGTARQDRNFDEQLNAIFNDPNMVANLGSIFTSGESVSGFKNFKETQVYGQAGERIMQKGGADGRVKVTSGEYLLDSNEGLALVMPGNMSPAARRSDDSIYARPDQFTNNGGLTDPINIVITHGDPGLNDKTSGILSYTPASSIILRGIHFIGEAQQVMADDQPIMETYKFIARSKESLISVKAQEPSMDASTGDDTTATNEAPANPAP